MIGSAYNLAIEQRLVTKNPTQGCALPKVEHKEMKTLTADQLSAFFQEARDSGVYELYYLDLATGLRRGELLGLKWTDVDFQHGVLKIQRAISRQDGKVVEAPLKTKNAYNSSFDLQSVCPCDEVLALYERKRQPPVCSRAL